MGQGKGLELTQSIQFNNVTKSVGSIPSNVDKLDDKSLPMESSASEKAQDVDDEEKARRIAEQDLYGSRKQVCLFYLFFMLNLLRRFTDASFRLTAALSSSGLLSSLLVSFTATSVLHLFMSTRRPLPASLRGWNCSVLFP